MLAFPGRFRGYTQCLALQYKCSARAISILMECCGKWPTAAGALCVETHDGLVPAMQSGAAFSGSARAAAIAVGTLDTPAKEFVRPFPKQVSTCNAFLRPLQSHVSCSQAAHAGRSPRHVLLVRRSSCTDTNSTLLFQVIVVVTHGWHVLCFDHNLQLLWDRSIKVTRQPERQQFQQFVRLNEQITLRAVPANG
jgi:hypothetical protein